MQIQQHHTFIAPTKRIKNEADLQYWKTSCPTYKDIIQFTIKYSEAVRCRKNSSCCDNLLHSKWALGLSNLLDKCIELITQVPPVPFNNPYQRYGNIAFRTWFEKLVINIDNWILDVIPTHFNVTEASKEITPYILGSLGSPQRLDYGTGHELVFVLFLIMCERLGCWMSEEAPAIIIIIFRKYLTLVRTLQMQYKLEPAGSHGAWGLDDYQFLPFLFGSAQLVDQETPFPTDCILEPAIIKENSSEYLYFEAIDYINKIKSGLFAEHSRLLYDISGIPTWSKINQGLIRMYQKEILDKFPIVQHLLFGSIIQFM